MKRINPEYVETIKEIINTGPYFELIGMSIEIIEPGRAAFEIEVEKKHLQPFGFVHGGVFSSVIDAAAFWAVFSEVDEKIGMTTIEMKVNLLAPANNGRLITSGRCIKIGKTIALGEAKVESPEGKLFAHGTATFMLIPDFLPKIDRPVPPKFIE